MVLDHVPDPSDAKNPFTDTLVTDDPELDTLPESVGNPLTVAPLAWEMMVTDGGVVTPDDPSDSILEALFGFQAISENIPVHTDTVDIPVEVDGVRMNEY